MVRNLNPSQADVKKVYREYNAIYQWEDPSHLGIPVPTHVAPFQIYYEVPVEADV